MAAALRKAQVSGQKLLNPLDAAHGHMGPRGKAARRIMDYQNRPPSLLQSIMHEGSGAPAQCQ